MEGVLWYVLTGTRGGQNRARILRALDERPRNANQLAENLDLDYKTVRHHLDVLKDNDIVRDTGDDYGAVYLPTDRARHNWETVEDIIENAVDTGERDSPGSAAGRTAEDETTTDGEEGNAPRDDANDTRMYDDG